MKRYDYGDTYFSKGEVNDIVNTVVAQRDAELALRDAELALRDAWNFKAITLSVTVDPVEVENATATAGTTAEVTVKVQADGDDLAYGDFDVTLAESDDIADGGTTPTIDDTTLTVVDGVGTTTLNVVAGTYVNDEVITVTASDVTAQDGRTITGDNATVTIIADA